MYTKEKNNIDKSLPPDKNDSWCDARHPPPSPPALYLRTNTPQREGDEMQLLIIKYINVYVYIYVSLRPLIPPPRLNKVDPNWAVRGVHTDVIQRIRLNSSTIWFFAGVGVIFCHAWHMLIGKQTCWFTIRVFIRERKKQILSYYFFPFGLVVPISTSFPTESRSFSITASVKCEVVRTHDTPFSTLHYNTEQEEEEIRTLLRPSKWNERKI
jgi:hypothetical protein